MRGNAITTAAGPPRRRRTAALGRLALALVALTLAALALPAGGPRRAAAAPAALTSEALAEQVLQLLNGERVAAGLAPLHSDATAMSVAQARARDMAEGDYLAHAGPSGVDALALLARAGVDYQVAGENIGRSNYDSDAVGGVIHRSWMASAGHRANMLDPAFQAVGIGVAQRGDTWYFAMVLIG